MLPRRLPSPSLTSSTNSNSSSTPATRHKTASTLSKAYLSSSIILVHFRKPHRASKLTVSRLEGPAQNRVPLHTGLQKDNMRVTTRAAHLEPSSRIFPTRAVTIRMQRHLVASSSRTCRPPSLTFIPQCIHSSSNFCCSSSPSICPSNL